MNATELTATIAASKLEEAFYEVRRIERHLGDSVWPQAETRACTKALYAMMRDEPELLKEMTRHRPYYLQLAAYCLAKVRFARYRQPRWQRWLRMVPKDFDDFHQATYRELNQLFNKQFRKPGWLL